MRTFLHKIKSWVKIKLTNPSSLKSSERYPNYQERFPWFGADLQTLRSFLIPKLKISNCKSSDKLTFQMTDGSGDQLTGTLSFPCCTIAQLPLIVLINVFIILLMNKLTIITLASLWCIVISTKFSKMVALMVIFYASSVWLVISFHMCNGLVIFIEFI